MIQLREISHRYRCNGQTVQALSGVSFSVAPGEACCVLGRSGCGKTTLLHIVGGMLMPTAGEVEIDGTVLSALPLHFLSVFRREKIGFIFQQFNLLKKFTAVENVLFPLVPGNTSLDEEREKVQPLLKRLAIEHRADFPVGLLSGGEQQRVAVARALVMNPKVIVADEPFSNLDAANSEVILELFGQLKSAGVSFVFSATSTGGPEMNFYDRVLDWDVK